MADVERSAPGAPRPLRVLLATGNQGKVRELRRMLAALDPGMEVLGLKDLAALLGQALPEVVEDKETFVGNAEKKARALAPLARAQGLDLVLADDSGLAVDALGGDPGVHSARYAGLPRSDQRNNEKLLAALAEVPDKERSARFICSIFAILSEGNSEITETFEGRCEGRILRAPRGEGGFGYDPLFAPVEDPQKTGRSMAELLPEEKNAISHRGRAFLALGEWLRRRAGRSLSPL